MREVKYRRGNREANDLICTSHGHIRHKLRGGKCWSMGTVQSRQG